MNLNGLNLIIIEANFSISCKIDLRNTELKMTSKFVVELKLRFWKGR